MKVNKRSVRPLGYREINHFVTEQLKTVTCKVRIDFVVLLVFGTFATRRRSNASVNYTTPVDTYLLENCWTG